MPKVDIYKLKDAKHNEYAIVYYFGDYAVLYNNTLYTEIENIIFNFNRASKNLSFNNRELISLTPSEFLKRWKYELSLEITNKEHENG